MKLSVFEMNFDNLKAVFLAGDSLKAVFLAGDKVSGHVHLNLDEPMKMTCECF